MSRLFQQTAVAVAVLALLSVPLSAKDKGSDKGSGRDPTFQLRNFQSFFEKRYPGDQAFAGGTVRFTGPEKGPYVERCHWTAQPGIYGIPFGLTQRCVRYTLENTPPQ